MKNLLTILFLFSSILVLGQANSTNFKGDIITNLQTNDGSTNAFTVKDSDGAIVESINSDGFYTIRYRDEYVGGDWVPASGGAAPDLVDVTIGGVATRVYAFDGGGTEERIANNFEMAHDIPFIKVNDGTYKIEVHTHFRPATNTAGVVKIFFDWSYTPEGGTPIAMTSTSSLYTIALNQIHYQFITGVELPIPAGGYGIGGVITFNTRRTPADAQDTYADDILFIKTSLHIPTDGNGSRQRYIK